MEFFNNTSNESLKFKLNTEGINLNKIEPRLILTTSDNKNYFFIGKLKEDVCEFTIPELALYEKDDNGKIKFEIISEDLYFPVWEDNFKVNTRASVKIEEMFNVETKPIVKPKISTSVIIEKTPGPIKKTEVNQRHNEQKFEVKKEREPNRDKIKETIDNSGIKKFISFTDFDR